MPKPHFVRGKIPPGSVCHALIRGCCGETTNALARRRQELPNVVVWPARIRNRNADFMRKAAAEVGDLNATSGHRSEKQSP